MSERDGTPMDYDKVAIIGKLHAVLTVPKIPANMQRMLRLLLLHALSPQ